jgi:hypothetical protein
MTAAEPSSIRVPTTAAPVVANKHGTPEQGTKMSRLVLDLLLPYRGWLVIVLLAMLVETAASLAAPWPLKLVIDDALRNHKLPEWLAWAHDYGIGRNTLGVALFAGLATVFIAVVASDLHRQLLHH